MLADVNVIRQCNIVLTQDFFRLQWRNLESWKKLKTSNVFSSFIVC